jgi:predicted lipid-binding transport protein (Tim44 family)
MEKTLQQQYQLIKEGKGNKDHFLKIAKYMFPEYITSGNDFDSTVHILKSKSLLSEGIGGIITQSPIQPDWFKIFNTKIAEAVGVKNTKEYGDQNEFEKPAPEVAKDLANQFDNNDPKNIDNLYGQSFLLGYLTEMWDEKNANKTVGELKDIVAKNMAKDINYYHTEASFGVKGIGYKKDVVGGGEPVAPKGKYKSSGYGDIPKAKTVKEGLNEAKRVPVAVEMKEVEKSSQAIALEAKLNAIGEAIDNRKAKLALAESEELAEMIDKSMIKTLNKEIKELEGHKAKTQKIYEKMTGKAKKEEIIGEDKLNNTQINEDDFEDENDSDSFDINQDWSKIKILGLETDHQGEWVMFADPEDPYLDEEGYSFAIEKRQIDQVANGEKIGVEDGSSISHYMTSQDAKKILSQI